MHLPGFNLDRIRRAKRRFFPDRSASLARHPPVAGSPTPQTVADTPPQDDLRYRFHNPPGSLYARYKANLPHSLDHPATATIDALARECGRRMARDAQARRVVGRQVPPSPEPAAYLAAAASSNAAFPAEMEYFDAFEDPPPSTLGEDVEMTGVPVPPIDRVPTELWEAAFVHLADDSGAVANVRLTCRRFHDAAWKAFGMTFNRKVFHPLTHCSAVSLATLASCGTAARQVTTLNLSTVTFSRGGLAMLRLWNADKAERGVGPDARAARLVGVACEDDYQRIMLYDEVAEGNGELAQRFVKALTGLRNVNAVEIVSWPTRRCWQWPAELTQGPESQHGMDEACRARLVDIYRGEEHAERRVLDRLREALLGNSILRDSLHELYVVPEVDMAALPLGLQIPLCSRETSVKPLTLFPALSKLDIQVEHNWLSIPSASAHGHLVPAFLIGMPALTTLHLSLPRMNEATGERVFGTRLFLNIAALPAFRQLRDLRLENLHLFSSTLFKEFLHKHAKTLRRLVLVQFTIPQGQWRELVVWMGHALQLEFFAGGHRASKWLGPGDAAHSPTQDEWKKLAREVSRWKVD
ncbi:hypothetical protein LTR53_003804 [Teratosphaeriaceae sp. CCFEE 6253]|nr:hypothetical protein LTR53_003804 [Teratosphaeriaceae sp. CCFEE 6253]